MPATNTKNEASKNEVSATPGLPPPVFSIKNRKTNKLHPTMITFLILLALYFLPTIIARDKQGVVGIFLLNFFLGWTFIGYIIALIWALAANPKPTDTYPTVAEELMRLERLQKSGVLSWAEFERQKTRLLYGYA